MKSRGPGATFMIGYFLGGLGAYPSEIFGVLVL